MLVSSPNMSGLHPQYGVVRRLSSQVRSSQERSSANHAGLIQPGASLISTPGGKSAFAKSTGVVRGWNISTRRLRGMETLWSGWSKQDLKVRNRSDCGNTVLSKLWLKCFPKCQSVNPLGQTTLSKFRLKQCRRESIEATAASA